MKRTSVTPSEWGLQFNMDQGELVECLALPDLLIEIEATSGEWFYR